ELARGGRRIGGRQCRKPGETGGICHDRGLQRVVGLARYRDCPGRIEDGLASRLVVRDHLQIDAGGIHGGDARLAEIEQRGDHVESEELLAVIAAMGPRWEALFLPWQDE